MSHKIIRNKNLWTAVVTFLASEKSFKAITAHKSFAADASSHSLLKKLSDAPQNL